jgi:hypothetical protein
VKIDHDYLKKLLEACQASDKPTDGRCDGPDGRIAEAPRQVLPADND